MVNDMSAIKRLSQMFEGVDKADVERKLKALKFCDFRGEPTSGKDMVVAPGIKNVWVYYEPEYTVTGDRKPYDYYWDAFKKGKDGFQIDFYLDVPGQDEPVKLDIGVDDDVYDSAIEYMIDSQFETKEDWEEDEDAFKDGEYDDDLRRRDADPREE